MYNVGGWDEDTCLWGRLGFKGWTLLESNGFACPKRGSGGPSPGEETYSDLLKLRKYKSTLGN